MSHDLFLQDLDACHADLITAHRAVRAAARNRTDITEADKVFIDALKSTCDGVMKELDELK